MPTPKDGPPAPAEAPRDRPAIPNVLRLARHGLPASRAPARARARRFRAPSL